MAFQESLFIRKIQVRFMSEVMFFVLRCNKDARSKKRSISTIFTFSIKKTYIRSTRSNLSNSCLSRKKKRSIIIIDYCKNKIAPFQVSINGYLEFTDPPERYTYPLVFPVKCWPKENDPSFIGIFFSKCRIGEIRSTDRDRRKPGVYFRWYKKKTIY